MRKKFILVVLIPLIIISVIVYFFIDGWIESAIEYAGEKAVGAKVEVDNLHVHLFPLGLDWGSLQVADPRDPWKNLFQTDKVKFAMSPLPLIRGKVIIETAEVHNLLLGTKRKTSGALPGSAKSKSSSNGAPGAVTQMADKALSQVVGSSPVFDIAKLKKGFKPDSLLKSFDFKTVKHIDTLKKQSEKIYHEWSNVKTDFNNSKNQLQNIEKEIKSINPSSLNNVQSITTAIATVDNSIKTVNDIKNTYTKRSISVIKEIKDFTASLDSTDDYMKEDFQKLKSMAKLPSINTPSIASLLVGSEMYSQMKNYLYWVNFARTNIKRYQPEPEYTKPPRMKGENIRFPVTKGYPKFWIKNVLITGGTAGKDSAGIVSLKGSVKNISSNQAITGQPITASLEGTANKRKLNLTCLIDRRKAEPFDEYTISLSGVPMGQFKLGRSNFLPTKITDASVNTSVKIKVPGSNFDSDINIKFTGTHFQFESKPRNAAERIVREVLQGINSFYVNLRLWNTKNKFDAALSTDLDKQISKKLRDVVGAEFAKLQNELRNKFDSYISQQKKKFNDQYLKKVEDIKKQLGSYSSLIDDKLDLVNNKKKDLLARLEKQKGNLIENKLKDLLHK